MRYSLRICHKIMVITIILSFTKWSKLTAAIIDFCQNNSDVTTPHSREVGSGARDYYVPPDKLHPSQEYLTVMAPPRPRHFTATGANIPLHLGVVQLRISFTVFIKLSN